MRTKDAWYNDAIIWVIILITGIVLGCTVKDWPLLTLKRDVDVIGALSSLAIIGATLFVAYYVANSIEKQKENNRVEKDLVIRRIDDIYDLIEEFSLKLASQDLLVATINSYIKRINVNSLHIINVVQKTSINIDEGHNNAITESIGRLRSLLTLTPTHEEGVSDAPPITVVDNITSLSERRKLEVDNELDTIKGLVFELELAINKG